LSASDDSQRNLSLADDSSIPPKKTACPGNKNAGYSGKSGRVGAKYNKLNSDKSNEVGELLPMLSDNTLQYKVDQIRRQRSDSQETQASLATTSSSINKDYCDSCHESLS
jgi:hypothetical protein